MFVYVMTDQHLKSRAVCFWLLPQQRFRVEWRWGRDYFPACSWVFFSETYVIITIMGMSVLWFFMFIHFQRDRMKFWTCVYFFKPKHMDVTLRLAHSFRLTSVMISNWHIFSPHWNIFYFCPNGGHVFQVFLEKNKPINNFKSWTACLLLCSHLRRAGVHFPSWFSWLCTILDDSAVCTYDVILPAYQETFYQLLLVRCILGIQESYSQCQLYNNIYLIYLKR